MRAAIDAGFDARVCWYSVFGRTVEVERVAVSLNWR